jgi:CubicO group peptidase (beta-lactamase class C family)
VLALGAAALSIPAAAVAEAEAPTCPNPPPALSASGTARDAQIAPAVGRLAAALDDERRQSRLVSLAIGVVHDQTQLLAAGFGCANLERGLPATPDTVYRVGSVTKVFEATALMQLRDAGRLRLDDAVDRYVPEAWYPGPNGDRVSPSWRQLASHTAGLQRNLQRTLGSVPELYRFLEHRTAAAEPGKVYAYSNLGFVLLGQAAAQVAGERYQDYVRRHIFAPLGMTASTYDIESVALERLAIGYLRVDRGEGGWSGYRAGYRDPFPPSGTILSTVNDLSRFLMLQFRNSPAGGAQILAPRTVREMWQPVAPTGAARAAAIGWFMSPFGDATLVQKDGGQPGFTALVQMVPEHRLGIVVLANESPEKVHAGGAFARVSRLVFDALLPHTAAGRRCPRPARGCVAPRARGGRMARLLGGALEGRCAIDHRAASQ